MRLGFDNPGPALDGDNPRRHPRPVGASDIGLPTRAEKRQGGQTPHVRLAAKHPEQGEGSDPDIRFMRPHQLTPLFAAAKSLAGIGPRMEILLRKALRLPPGASEPRIIDLLWHTPTGVIDRRATPTVAEAVPGTIATLERRVLRHKPVPRGNTRAPYKVTCEDESGRIDLVFFHAEHKFIERQLPTGTMRTVSGRIESYNDK